MKSHPLLGPIDWDAWEVEMRDQARDRRFGPKSPEMKAKFSAAQKLRFANQRAKLAEALRNAAPAPAAPINPFTVEERVFAAMYPGAWYSTRDMHKASGCKYQSCKVKGPLWLREGKVERARNPDWKPPARPGGPQEPHWLYRLTGKGLERRSVALALQ